jgi:molybdopterin-binding protein
VPVYRIAEAAGLLGVSDDTLRRWIEEGKVTSVALDNGRAGIEGTDLVTLMRERPQAPTAAGSSSARNRLTGVVTRVVRDTVMAQVELQCGPYRLVSLMSREAADELALEPGCRAVASVKATAVVVDLP